MKKILLLGLACCLACLPLKAQTAQPTPAQAAFEKLERGMFIHFSINTYHNTEWSYGDLDPATFNPTKLDTDQWCEAAIAAGMKYVVLTAKHHDGFCLWPSKYTDYSVASSPFQGDVVALLAESCRKYGLKLGIYYSLWDSNAAFYSDDFAYTNYMIAQLDELLTNYGDVALIWFDGAWDKLVGHYPAYTKETIQAAWRNGGAFRWNIDYVYQFIKSKQPACLVMNNSGLEFPGIPLFPTDIRSGERAEKEDPNLKRKVWPFNGTEYYLPMQIETTIAAKWFYDTGDTLVKSAAELKPIFEWAKEEGTCVLLNVPPDRQGLLLPQHVAVLKELGKAN